MQNGYFPIFFKDYWELSKTKVKFFLKQESIFYKIINITLKIEFEKYLKFSKKTGYFENDAFEYS